MDLPSAGLQSGQTWSHAKQVLTSTPWQLYVDRDENIVCESSTMRELWVILETPSCLHCLSMPSMTVVSQVQGVADQPLASHE